MDGNTLKAKLVRFKKTQGEIAEILGIKQPSVSSYFAASDLRTSTIEKLASALNVPVSYFYGEQSANAVASNGSVAAVNSNIENGGSSMAARIDNLESLIEAKNEIIKEKERLLDEKERTIQILIGKQI